MCRTPASFARWMDKTPSRVLGRLGGTSSSLMRKIRQGDRSLSPAVEDRLRQAWRASQQKIPPAQELPEADHPVLPTSAHLDTDGQPSPELLRATIPSSIPPEADRG